MHKVQGLNLSEAVFGFNLEKQSTFKPGQMYVSLSRIKNLQGLFFTGIFCKEAIKAREYYLKNIIDYLIQLPSISAPVVFFLIIHCFLH